MQQLGESAAIAATPNPLYLRLLTGPAAFAATSQSQADPDLPLHWSGTLLSYSNLPFLQEMSLNILLRSIDWCTDGSSSTKSISGGTLPRLQHG
jgi:hypothetical protein